MTYYQNVQIQNYTQAKGFVQTKQEEFNLSQQDKVQLCGRALATAQQGYFIQDAVKHVYYSLIKAGIIPDKNDQALRHNDSQFVRALYLLYIQEGSVVINEQQQLSLTEKGQQQLQKLRNKVYEFNKQQSEPQVKKPARKRKPKQVSDKQESVQMAFKLFNKHNPFTMIEKHEKELGLYNKEKAIQLSNETTVEEEPAKEDNTVELHVEETILVDQPEELTDDEQEEIIDTEIGEEYVFEEETSQEDNEDSIVEEQVTTVFDNDTLISTYLPEFYTKSLNKSEVEENIRKYGPSYTQAIEYFVEQGFVNCMEIKNPYIETAIYSITDSGKLKVFAS